MKHKEGASAMNEQTKRRAGRPSKPDRKQRINVTLSPDTLHDLETHIPEKQRSAHIEHLLNEDDPVLGSIKALIGMLRREPIIRSIEPISVDTLTEKDWEDIRGPGSLVGNGPIFGVWLVSWTPAEHADAPHPWKVMVVKSISPVTGKPAFMTTPARGVVPVYFNR